MSAREWQPGDVLTGHINSQFRGREAFFVVEVTENSRAAWGPGLHAVNADGNGYAVANIIDPQPVVSIDLTDKAAIKRLADAFCLARWDHVTSDTECDPLTFSSMQAALREFASPPPPKPEVYSHVVTSQRNGIATAACGKTWRPNSGDVVVVGKCPECQAVVGMWTA